MTVGYTKNANTIDVSRRTCGAGRGKWDVTVYKFHLDGTEVVDFIQPFDDESRARAYASKLTDARTTADYLDTGKAS